MLDYLRPRNGRAEIQRSPAREHCEGCDLTIACNEAHRTGRGRFQGQTRVANAST